MEPSTLNDTFIEAPIRAVSHPLNPIGVNHTLPRKHINVISYNIFLRPPFIKNNESDHKDARLKEFIKLLDEFDIVCLEEMFGFLNRRKHKMIRCATKAGFLYYADAVSPSFFTSFVVDGGLLVLSRFPIIASEFKPFPYGIFSDSLSQKGVLYVKVQIKDEVLHLFQTHTQASYFGENQRYPILTRGDQWITFRQFMLHCYKKYGYKPGEMVLMVGDFNVDSRKPFIETSKVMKYPGFKLYPHLARNEMFNEYEAMLCMLSDNHNDEIEDLLLKTYGEHPITYGDSYVDDNKELKPLETILTLPEDHCSNQSLDYIFLFNPKSLYKKGDDVEDQPFIKQRKLKVIDGSARVEKFFIEDCEFTQLSDHYGVMVSLEYTESSGHPNDSMNKTLDDSHSRHHEPKKVITLD